MVEEDSPGLCYAEKHQFDEFTKKRQERLITADGISNSNIITHSKTTIHRKQLLAYSKHTTGEIAHEMSRTLLRRKSLKLF